MKIIKLGVVAAIVFATGCSNTPDTTPLAFLYQTVGNMQAGVGNNTVELGIVDNGTAVESLDQSAVVWSVGGSNTNSYGDPVFSRLDNGNWAMTAWTSPEDTRGRGNLLYYESECPVVIDEEVTVIAPATEAGCMPTQMLTGGKTSQIFAADDGNYVFHMINGSIYLARLSDTTHVTKDLNTMCVVSEPVESLADLGYGESTLVLNKTTYGDLLMSDTAMAQREDGTWVLFVKGIESNNRCTPNTICELCARSIYRTTSTDLLHWSELEKVVEQASVPEATTTAEGQVQLYWQDFSDTCTAQDQKLGAIAPLSMAYELPSGELSEPVRMSFPDEAFEGNSALHYATNANPVMLPDAAAVAAYEACASN